MNKKNEKLLKQSKILFLDDMEASHKMMREIIKKYNIERNRNILMEEYYNTGDVPSKGSYLCGIFDWHLDKNEKGEQAIEKIGSFCFHRCIITGQCDDMTAPNYATKNQCWYITKKNESAMYLKIRDYFDFIFYHLQR